MDEAEFNRVADGVINYLAEGVDDILGDTIDVDIQGGILILELADRRQYVINKHGPNQEIWLSSPISGAAHFKLVGDQWRSTRNSEIELKSVLEQELGISF